MTKQYYEHMKEYRERIAANPEAWRGAVVMFVGLLEQDAAQDVPSGPEFAFKRGEKFCAQVYLRHFRELVGMDGGPPPVPVL